MEKKIMKKLFLLIGILLLATSGIFGKEKNHPSFYIHTGLSGTAYPEKYREYWTTGVNVGAGIGKQFSSLFEGYGGLLFNYFTLDRNGIESTLPSANEFTVINGEPTSILQFFAKAKLNFPRNSNDKIIPYLYGSIGLFRLNEKDITITQEKSDSVILGNSQNTFGGEMGMGFDIKMEDTILFIEIGADLGLVKQQNRIFLPLKVGVLIK